MEMQTPNPGISEIFNHGRLPRLAAAYFIDEGHNSRYARLLHVHDSELELYYAVSGQGRYQVEGIPYAIQKGDMIVCNAGVLHGDDKTGGRKLRSYCLAISNVSVKGLPDNWLMDQSLPPVVSCGALADKVGALMELIYMLSIDLDALGEVCSSMAVSLLLLTRQLILSKARHEERRRERIMDALVKEMKDYLDAHYSQKVTLEEASRTLGIKASYISRLFKQEMGISPIQYALCRKFGEAQSMLMDTELSVNEISDLLGFAGPAHFNAMFKKHVGIPPGQYRQSIEEMRAASFSESLIK